MAFDDSTGATPLAAGDQVKHERFGPGVVELDKEATGVKYLRVEDRRIENPVSHTYTIDRLVLRICRDEMLCAVCEMRDNPKDWFSVLDRLLAAPIRQVLRSDEKVECSIGVMRIAFDATKVEPKLREQVLSIGESWAQSTETRRCLCHGIAS